VPSPRRPSTPPPSSSPPATHLPTYLSTYLLVQFPTPSGPYGNALKLTLVFQSRARRLHLHDLSCRAASRTLPPPRVCCSAHADGQARLRDLTRNSLSLSLSVSPVNRARVPNRFNAQSVRSPRVLSSPLARFVAFPRAYCRRPFIPASAERPYLRARASAADVPSRFPQPVSD